MFRKFKEASPVRLIYAAYKHVLVNQATFQQTYILAEIQEAVHKSDEI